MSARNTPSPHSPTRDQAKRRSRSAARKRELGLLIAAAVMTVVTVVGGVIAAEPIYQTDFLWIAGAVGAAVAWLVVWLGMKLRWGAMTLAALAVAFVIIVVPIGVPTALSAGPTGLVTGLGDGLAAVALGWKQLLTLTLPVGSYQAVLVPFLTVIYVAVAAATALTLNTHRWRPFAAIGIVAPVLFGTVFGSSAVSDPATLFGVTINAPRELALWLCTFGAATVWVAWASGRDRRAALRRGRTADAELEGDEALDPHPANQPTGRGAVRRNAVVRGAVAGVVVIAAVAGALALAPVVTDSVRTVPRDAIDPELVVRDRVSPLASYRAWKRDAMLNAPVFTVSSADGELPSRLRLAVLSGYEGVDFTVGDPGLVGRFTRFPSGGKIDDPKRVTVQIAEGYSDVWVPIASPLASPPRFTGPRAAELGDSFYLNRDTGSAVTVTPSTDTAVGLREGDGYTAVMSGAPDTPPAASPASPTPLVDLDTMPQLERWLTLQELPVTGDGLVAAIERLRERGYLSHSLTEGEGEGAWVQSLNDEAPLRFVSSTGGHSEARIEQLFQQLADQQVAAGVDASPAMLVAGIGDDEQFATAAALIARAMGYDSRVVVGVRLGGESDGVPGTPACADVCTGEHLAAWIEVRGRDGAWAPLDVSPQIALAPTLLEKGEQLPEFPTQPEERNATESDPPLGMINQDGGDTGGSDATNLSALWPILRAVGLMALGLALISLFVLFIPLVKWLRARRRRTALAPEVRVLGAWDELLDAYSDSGQTQSRERGREAIMHELGVDGGDWIAWTVDQAVYSREGITAETAEHLWEIVDARVNERRQSLSFWRRLTSRFSFASFRRVSGGARGAKARRNKKEALR